MTERAQEYEEARQLAIDTLNLACHVPQEHAREIYDRLEAALLLRARELEATRRRLFSS